MAISLPFLMEDPKKPYKAKDHYPKKAKGMSFIAFLLSIFVYISIFYIFDLSPSTLCKTSKFWFLISNTLILILALDYGAFSSSKHKQPDIYDEYLTRSEHNKHVRPLTSYREIAAKSHTVHERAKTLDTKSLQITSATEDIKDDVQEKRIVHVDNKKRFEANEPEVRSNSYRRSKSEKAKKVVIDETAKDIILKRSETVKEQENHNHVVETVNNEFATMSDEDLNRRVEEFIQRFNRQIRLQARADKYN